MNARLRGYLRSARQWLAVLGIYPRRARTTLAELPDYFRRLRQWKASANGHAAEFPLTRLYPCPGEKSAASGAAGGHYFHQDLLVARRIHEINPARHMDVGSRIDGFVAHIAAFRSLMVLDIRSQPAAIPNVTFVQADLMAQLPVHLRDCCDSLSCLHALEHFGLGRYGDPLRGDGHLLGLANLHRLLASGGRLYLSVPIGPQRVEFDAHRVFGLAYLMQILTPLFRLDRFSFVDDAGGPHENVPLDAATISSNASCTFGCGIFELIKP